MDYPQLFWDEFRPRLRVGFRDWNAIEADLRRKAASAGRAFRCSDISTPIRTRSAIEACYAFGERLGRKLKVGQEGFKRTDVHAVDFDSLVVALETELSRPGQKDDWRHEFEQLCAMPAELRVLTGTIAGNKWTGYQDYLEGWLKPFRAKFEAGHSGMFCLAFGPEDSKKYPDHYWLAYSLEPDYTLRELDSAKKLRPRPLIDWVEPVEE